MTDDAAEPAIRNLLQTYVDAFVVGDAAAVACHCVPPFLWINAAGTIAATTVAELEARYAAVITALRARGFTGTRYERLDIHVLGPDLALASGIAARQAGDAELERGGFTYLLRRVDDNWRIAMLTAHPVSGAWRAAS